MTAAAPSRLLIHDALVVTMDPALGDLDRADVLVEGRHVVAVGRNLPADGVETRIDARDMLLIPGLIDSHTHMWQGPLRGIGVSAWGMADYTRHVFPLREQVGPDEMEDACFAAGVEMLDHGVTTVLDFCHNVMSPAHAERALAAHRRTGQRILFAYGMLGKFDSLARDQAWRLAQVRELQQAIAAEPQPLVRLGIALGSLEYAGMDLVAREIAVGRELGLPMSFHQNPPGQLQALADAGLLGGDLLPVHANVATDAELALLAGCGAGISFTVEGEFGGGRPMSIVGRAHRAGVWPALGVDIPSRVAMELFGQMRLTYLLMRAEEAAAERANGRWPLARRAGTPFTEPRHVLEFVTVNGARAIGLGDCLGRIAPGCLADLVLLRTGPYGRAHGDPAAHVVLQSSVADVDTVIVDGRIRKRGGRLTGLDPAEALAATRRVQARVFGRPGPAPAPAMGER